MTVTIDKPCQDNYEKTIPIGTTVEYRGHLPGGMIMIRFEDRLSVIDPRATKELR